MNLGEKKILITGASGFLGGHVLAALKEAGVPKSNIRSTSSKEYDLRLLADCERAVEGIDVVIHLAAKVGGIGFNLERPGELFYDNLVMGVHLMEAARRAGVEKFVGLGTVCAYPKMTKVPFKEEDIWNGYPEETNAPYGLAKKMLLVQAEAYRKQYDFNAITLFPVNLYGPRDNFEHGSSHVIAAIIRKTHEALREGEKSIELWGDGSPTREFLYVADAAKAILLAAQKYSKSHPVNIGSGLEVSIRDLAEMITAMMGFDGEIIWDSSKPNGQPRRRLDVSRAEKEFGFKAEIALEDGLRQTIDWYLENS